MCTGFSWHFMMSDTSGPPATMRGMIHDGYRMLHWESGWLLSVCGSAMKLGGLTEVSQHPSTMSAGLLRRTFTRCSALELSALIASTQRTIAAQLEIGRAHV